MLAGLYRVVRPTIKRRLGRHVSVDLLERLTEWSLEEREPSVSLRNTPRLNRTGHDWSVIESGRREVWAKLLGLAGEDILLLEFGSWKGDSMKSFATMNKSPRSLFYGFDSFEGLPEDWRHYRAGVFDTNGQIPSIDDARVKFVKGWFRDTVPPMLGELASHAQGRSIVVHYDADIYSSTIYLLFALGLHFKSYYFIFDEFSGHETRALYNYMQATGAKANFFQRLDWHGSPTVVSGDLTTP